MKLLVVAAAALAWAGLWFHELHRVPRLLVASVGGSAPSD